MKRFVAFALVAVVAQTAAPRPAAAQTVTRLASEPDRIEVTAGESVPLVIRAYGLDGAEVATPLRVGGSRDGIRLSDGRVTGLSAGEYSIYVSSVPEPGEQPVTLEIPVIVDWPPVARAEVVAGEGRLFVGSRIKHDLVAFHADGTERP